MSLDTWIKKLRNHKISGLINFIKLMLFQDFLSVETKIISPGDSIIEDFNILIDISVGSFGIIRENNNLQKSFDLAPALPGLQTR